MAACDATAKYFDIDWLRSKGAEPHWFGLGFIQLKLDAYERMHFWHPDLTADINEEELHDHRYAFRSAILVGSLTHEEWLFEHSPEGDHEMVLVSCKPGQEAPPEPIGRGWLKPGNTYTMAAGSHYAFSEHGFHRIRARKAVTLLTRGPVVKDHARVIRPSGTASACPFSRTIPEDKLWGYIEDLLSEGRGQRPRLEKPGYHLVEIPKGELGEPSKIVEEAMEFADAISQQASIMGLVELSDLYGAVEAYLERHHPSIDISQIKAMSDITRRAFQNGHR